MRESVYLREIESVSERERAKGVRKRGGERWKMMQEAGGDL